MLRYQVDKVVSPLAFWRFNHKARAISAGKLLRIDVLARASIHWSADGWKTCADADTRDTGLGAHIVDLPVTGLAAGAKIDFTFHWLDADRWEGRDFAIEVSA